MLPSECGYVREPKCCLWKREKILKEPDALRSREPWLTQSSYASSIINLEKFSESVVMWSHTPPVGRCSKHWLNHSESEFPSYDSPLVDLDVMQQRTTFMFLVDYDFTDVTKNPVSPGEKWAQSMMLPSPCFTIYIYIYIYGQQSLW